MSDHDSYSDSLFLGYYPVIYENKNMNWRAKHRTYMLRWRWYCAEVIDRKAYPTTAAKQSPLPAPT